VKTLSKCKLQIGLLGPFYLMVNNEEIQEEAWKSKKALTLLKYLAARAGQKVSATGKEPSGKGAVSLRVSLRPLPGRLSL